LIKEVHAKKCIYCGESRNLNKDHIPPKNLFAKPRPANLITVPSCKLCNESFRKDDEYFQIIMHTRFETGGHPELLKLKAKLARSLKREESVRFHKKIKESIFTAEVVSKGGLYLGMAPALRVQGKRLERVATRIVRGLFYFEKGFSLAGSHEAIAYADPMRGNDDPQSVVRVVSFMVQRPAKVIGNNVFRYSFEI
jgi:hypothetical protein